MKQHVGETKTSNVYEDINVIEMNNINGKASMNNKVNDGNSSCDYDPQQVTVPLTLCLGIMVG